MPFLKFARLRFSGQQIFFGRNNIGRGFAPFFTPSPLPKSRLWSYGYRDLTRSSLLKRILVTILNSGPAVRYRIWLCTLVAKRSLIWDLCAPLWYKCVPAAEVISRGTWYGRSDKEMEGISRGLLWRHCTSIWWVWGRTSRFREIYKPLDLVMYHRSARLTCQLATYCPEWRLLWKDAEIPCDGLWQAAVEGIQGRRRTLYCQTSVLVAVSVLL